MNPLTFLAEMPRVWWFSIFSGAFFVFWIWLSSCYQRAFRRFGTWPSVPGRLISASTELRHGGEDGYTPSVRYRYQVGGEVYEGHVIESLDLYIPPKEPLRFHRRERADLYISQIHSDGNVTVYYHPDDPAQAYLRQSSAAPFYFGWAVAVLFLVLGCVLPWLK